MLKKIVWFVGIFFTVIAATAVLLTFLEPGNTNSGELGYRVGKLILPILLVTTAIFFGAKRMGWILKART
ncbi:hypothetical protein [Solilutibacter tolerans]|uniref:Uncharacterized protein n=1 Tax=Solilutibacter tolerans TaxID=1604334 RepID=A0A1N6VAL8_9GAMM|nr:hypothetical protein [Lysobacter tolerans]SIQ74807.1 hypothetical protein SAMN05421546_1719 [Lysobacter tolerans]